MRPRLLLLAVLPLALLVGSTAAGQIDPSVSRIVIVKTGAGTGTVKDSFFASPNCGADCVVERRRFEEVRLDAVPHEGSYLHAWEGCAPDPAFLGEQCLLTPDRDEVVVTARFEPRPATCPESATYRVLGGAAAVTFDPATSAALRARGIRVAAKRPARRSGATVTMPVARRWTAPAGTFNSRVQLSGIALYGGGCELSVGAKLKLKGELALRRHRTQRVRGLGLHRYDAAFTMFPFYEVESDVGRLGDVFPSDLADAVPPLTATFAAPDRIALRSPLVFDRNGASLIRSDIGGRLLSTAPSRRPKVIGTVAVDLRVDRVPVATGEP